MGLHDNLTNIQTFRAHIQLFFVIFYEGQQCTIGGIVLGGTPNDAKAREPSKEVASRDNVVNKLVCFNGTGETMNLGMGGSPSI